jgi:uncharacterized membrane protein YfcA
MDAFWTFALVGFIAQLIDGALGMGFGVISSSILLGQGVAPALVSASVNAAKIPTTGTAAFSHLINRNLDKNIVLALCVFGSLGGIVGMSVLTSLKGPWLNSLVMGYLYFIGALIIWRGITGHTPRLLSSAYKRLVGFVGGVIEGIGGSWGPIVTTSLLGSGIESRYAIGSSNFSEFVVSVVVFTAYVAAFASGHWDGGSDWKAVAYPVAGLVVGGLPAALAGGWLARVAPKRPLTIAVGMLAVGIAVYRMVTG